MNTGLYYQKPSSNKFPCYNEPPAPEFATFEKIYYDKATQCIVLVKKVPNNENQYVMMSPKFGIRWQKLPKLLIKDACLYMTKNILFEKAEFHKIFLGRDMLEKFQNERTLVREKREITLDVEGTQLFYTANDQLKFVDLKQKNIEFIYAEKMTRFSTETADKCFKEHTMLKMLLYVQKEWREPTEYELQFENYEVSVENVERDNEGNIPFVSLFVVFNTYNEDTSMHQPFPLYEFDSTPFTENVRKWIENKLISALNSEFSTSKDEELEELIMQAE